jgi:hypothetical protein
VHEDEQNKRKRVFEDTNLKNLERELDEEENVRTFIISYTEGADIGCRNFGKSRNALGDVNRWMNASIQKTSV